MASAKDGTMSKNGYSAKITALRSANTGTAQTAQTGGDISRAYAQVNALDKKGKLISGNWVHQDSYVEAVHTNKKAKSFQYVHALKDVNYRPLVSWKW